MKVFSRLLLSALSLAFSVAALAQPASAAYAPTAAENSLLWRILAPDSQDTSYLYGTIHMIPAEHYAFSPQAEYALENSTRVAFEIDMKEMNDPMALMPMLSQIMMRNDTTLADLLSEEEYRMVNDHFAEIGLPMFLFERVKPMFLSAMVSEDISSFRMGGGQEIRSYEMEISRMAEAQEKEILGLETIAFQMGLFDRIPYHDQAQMLLEGIQAEQADDAEGGFDAMVEMYKAQDIVGMVELMGEEGAAGLGGYEEILLLQRNRNWIPEMEKLMTGGTVFFAVGAGHLAGPEGVIALLRARGYRVEPVR